MSDFDPSARFSHNLQQVLAKGKPEDKEIIGLIKQLRAIVSSIRIKLGWRPKKSAYLSEQEEEETGLVIAGLLHRYREHPMPSRITGKATSEVLKGVRNHVRRVAAEEMRRLRIPESEIETIPSADQYLFSSRLETEVEELERLHENGVIDKTQYYLMAAVLRQGETVRRAAARIELDEEIARRAMWEARENIEEHLRELDELMETRGRMEPWCPPPAAAPGPGRPRTKVPEEKLLLALKAVLV